MKTVNTHRRLFSALSMALASALSQIAYGMETGAIPSPEQQRTASFQKTDANGDGFVTREEFADANYLTSATPTSDRDLRAIRIMDSFKAMDGDADGRVSAKEYMDYLEQYGK